MVPLKHALPDPAPPILGLIVIIGVGAPLGGTVTVTVTVFITATIFPETGPVLQLHSFSPGNKMSPETGMPVTLLVESNTT